MEKENLLPNQLSKRLPSRVGIDTEYGAHCPVGTHDAAAVQRIESNWIPPVCVFVWVYVCKCVRMECFLCMYVCMLQIACVLLPSSRSKATWLSQYMRFCMCVCVCVRVWKHVCVIVIHQKNGYLHTFCIYEQYICMHKCTCAVSVTTHTCKTVIQVYAGDQTYTMIETMTFAQSVKNIIISSP